jgi:hypothetical protein
VPNICVEELPVAPGDAVVVFDDDEEFRLLLQAEATTTIATTTADPMNMRLLCLTDPPYQRRSAPRRLWNMTIASLDGRKGVENPPRLPSAILPQPA